MAVPIVNETRVRPLGQISRREFGQGRALSRSFPEHGAGRGGKDLPEDVAGAVLFDVPWAESGLFCYDAC